MHHQRHRPVVLGPGYLDYVAAELNDSVPQRLGWNTPAKAFDQLLSAQQIHQVFAMTA